MPLGEAFHSRRLQIVSSQVGLVPAQRRGRWSFKRRMDKAMSLLTDPSLDNLISHQVEFEDTPDQLPSLFTDPSALGIALRYRPAATL